MKTNITIGVIKIYGSNSTAKDIAFGDLRLKEKGVYNCVPNTGTELAIGDVVEDGKLEIGDIVTGRKDLNILWESAEYLGGSVLDKENSYKPLLWIDMETNCGISIPVDPVVNADATVTEWSAWSSCNNSLQTRTRTVLTPATGTGSTPILIEEQACVMPTAVIHYAVRNDNSYDITVNWIDANNAFRTIVQSSYSDAQYFAVQDSLVTESSGVIIEIVEQ